VEADRLKRLAASGTVSCSSNTTTPPAHEILSGKSVSVVSPCHTSIDQFTRSMASTFSSLPHYDAAAVAYALEGEVVGHRLK
jgi:hypothetical protein